jgi:hypothetical protein
MLDAAEKVRYEVPAQQEQNGRGSGAQSLPEMIQVCKNADEPRVRRIVFFAKEAAPGGRRNFDLQGLASN